MILPFDVAVVDIETSGLKPSDSILQMAVITSDTGRSGTSEWCSYVRPKRVLTAHLGPTHIHGIRRRNLLLAPSLPTAMRRLAALTNGRVVVAHNAPFDVGFLRAAAETTGVRLDWSGVLCTLDLSRRLDPQRRKNHKLASLCRDYGIVLDQAHDALHDSRATAELLGHLLGPNGIDSLERARDYFLS